MASFDYGEKQLTDKLRDPGHDDTEREPHSNVAGHNIIVHLKQLLSRCI